MKKIVSLILAATLILSVAVMGGCDRVNEKNKGTKSYEVTKILSGDTYVFELVVSGIETTFYRKGENLRFDTFGYHSEFIVNGERIKFNNEHHKAVITPASEEDTQSLLGSLSEFDKMLRVHDSDFEGTGYAEFDLLEEELYYEDFRVEDGSLRRAYFREDEIVGFEIISEGGKLAFKVSITDEVPDDAFDIPEKFEIIRGESD